MQRSSAGPVPPRAPSAGDRIAKLLARAGIASRREVERMIAEGRVALNGTPVATPATVLASLAGVTVDGNPVAAPAPARLFLYHKPVGLLVTERDPRRRPTIYDRLPAELPRVVPVGRLDLNTEGLLLLTTDGGLKRQLELPATGVERSYRARAYGQVSQAQLEELIHGIEIDGVRYGQIDANLERRTGANVWIEMTLTEGKNREVRRVLEHLGLQVGRLIRTRYGPFVLGDLPVGEVGEVRQHDLVVFRQTLAGKRGASIDPIEPEPIRPRRSAAPSPASPSPGAKQEAARVVPEKPARPSRRETAERRPAAGARQASGRTAERVASPPKRSPAPPRDAKPRSDRDPAAPRPPRGAGPRPPRPGARRPAKPRPR